MIKRHLEDIIQGHLFKNKSIIIYGARQVGKTTLVHKLVKKQKAPVLFLNADDADIREIFLNVNASKLVPLFSDYKIVVLDEAQRIADAGLVIKIIHDNFKNIQLIVTGSSPFELADRIKEPTTGRKFEFTLHPFSFSEMTRHHGFLTERRLLEHRMIYGYYPDVAINIGAETKILKTLASDYLYKDILAIGHIKKPVLLEKILKALALQVGSEVSYHELAQLLESDKGTIEKYIDLLEKTYIIFKLPGLNRNVRNEIKKGRKIYFYDNGIRNTVLGNFLPLNSRVDTGALWENFLISERSKILANSDDVPNCYFWRTTQQQEIDYIEERHNRLFAFEFKWNPLKKPFLSKTFSNAYPGSEFKVISPDNIYEYLGEGEVI
jgi:predicted AAA+ superfamily ATPase